MTENKTILCVEDDADSLELLRVILETEGYKVKPCETSEEALTLARQGGFSAIILDHWLEQISGVDICRKIRTYDQKTPIIFYSGAAYPKDKEIGLAAGAQDYLVKPNDFDKIAETISRLTS